jgi:23S rRNA pseudouridine2605 synthase
MTQTNHPAPARERLQRVLADAGVAARRVCEQMIEEGRVSVNGQVPRRLPVFVDPQRDRITVDGRPIPRPQRLVYVMLHKPEATLVTTSDEPGMERRTVKALVDHPAAARLYPVGRLDYDTTGLVLLTNDGELANKLSHPKFGFRKVYHALIKGTLSDADLGLIQRRAVDVAKKIEAESRAERRERLGPGPQPGPRKRALKPLSLRILREAEGKTTLEVELVESKHRPLKEVLLSIGLTLRKLTRVAFGPLELKGLSLGNWRELTRDEVKRIKLAAEGKIPKARVMTPQRERDMQRHDERIAQRRARPADAPLATPQARFADQSPRPPMNKRPDLRRASRAGSRTESSPPRPGRNKSSTSARPPRRPSR